VGDARDRQILIAGAFVRAAAVGFVGVALGLHLREDGLDGREVALVVAAGLGGAALAATIVTLVGDRLPRRVWLSGACLLGAAGGVGLAFAGGLVPAICAAFAGMVNGAGRDRGLAPIVDQAALPATTDDAGRTRAFAYYAFGQDVGHAAGALAAGLPLAIARAATVDPASCLRGGLFVYSAALAVLAFLYARLSPAIEPAAPSSDAAAAAAAVVAPLSPATRRVTARISALFAIDAVGGGFLTSTLLTLMFVDRFHVGAGVVAVLFAASRILNAFSHLGAAWLARRIGLVRTMVFTHLPSSLLLLTVPFAPTFWLAALLFLLREGLVEMDVPTRQSYVMAVVAPAERTRVAGITQLVRLLGWALGPLIAALLGGDLVTAVILGATLKITYDLLLFAAFQANRPPEEVPPT
jgi:MFS family permease